MPKVKFGPSGNSRRFYELGYAHTTQAPKYLSQLGLDAFEYSFGRGVSISDDKAKEIGAEANEYGIAVSVHAPYYINFANESDEMVEKSYNYCLSGARKVLLMGGNRVVVHVASVGKLQRDDAVELSHIRLRELARRATSANLGHVKFCLETMGKINQIGTLEEIISFCQLSDMFIPTIDFGHLYARSLGEFCGYESFKSAIETMFAQIGEDKTRNMHVHFSKIEFSKGGEVKHLRLDDTNFGPDFEPLARLIHEYELTPTILSESDGTQDIDAQYMKRTYESIFAGTTKM